MKRHLQYNWWKYIAILLLSVILWTTVFDILKTPRPEEQVNVLYIGQKLDTDALQQQLQQVLPTLTKQPLKKIAVDTELPANSQFSSVLGARLHSYDIILIEAPYMQDNIGQNIFVRLTEPLIAQFPHAQTYTEMTEAGVLTYGFAIPGESRFCRYYTGGETCYLFVSPYSVNFNALNETGSPGNDSALKAAQYLLEITP